MDSDKRSAQVERLEVVDTGRGRRWSEDERLKIVLESLRAPRLRLPAELVGSARGMVLFDYYNPSLGERMFIGRREFMAAFGAAVSAPVVAGAVLTGGGGVGLPPVTINSDWTTYNYQNNSGGDLASPYVPIPFYAYVNPFNTGGLVRGTDYTTSVVVHPSTFPSNTVFTWSFPEVTASGHVYEADLVVWGSYFNGVPQTSIPPCQAQNLTTLTVTTDYSISGETAFFNLIYDFYLYPTTAVTSTIDIEFSIFLHDQSYSRAMVDSLASNLKFNWTDSEGTEWVIWTLDPVKGAQIRCEFANFTDIPSGYVIDIKGLIDAVVAHGWASGASWFVGTGLGAEAAQGNGSWTLNSYSFNYNGTTYP
jgi:transposase